MIGCRGLSICAEAVLLGKPTNSSFLPQGRLSAQFFADINMRFEAMSNHSLRGRVIGGVEIIALAHCAWDFQSSLKRSSYILKSAVVSRRHWVLWGSVTQICCPSKW